MSRAARRGPRRAVALACALLLAVVAATAFRPPAASGPFARDFEAYYAAGAAWNAGGDPWSRAVWTSERTIAGVDAQRDELLPFVGPAAELPLLGMLARWPQPVAVRVWTTLLIAALLALAAASLGIARVRGARVIIGTLLFAFLAAPATSDLALGQAAVIASAGLACALLAFDRKRMAAGAFATLVAAIQPNLALVLAARMRDRVAFGSAAIGFTAFAALTLGAGGGLAGVVQYARLLGAHGNAERFDAIQFTPAAIAWSFGAPAGAASAIGIAGIVAAVITVIVVTVRLRLDAIDGTLLAIAALPFAVPFFHEHDFVIELIPLIALAVRSRARIRAAAGVAAGLILVDWLTLAQRVPAQPAIVLQGLAVACAFGALGVGRRLERADFASPLTVLLAALIAVPVARAFPAPTWPDALPAAFHAPRDASASDVWAQEQRATGLLAQTPAWGVLRALPLAGCVVLGATLAASRRRAPKYPLERDSRTAS